MSLEEVKQIVNRLKLNCLGVKFKVKVNKDIKGGDRIFLQLVYEAPCTKTGEYQEWKGRKWYLSEYMTSDEVVKTAYSAFKQAIEHEILEGFRVDGKILFNPHVSFEELLKVTDKETVRK